MCVVCADTRSNIPHAGRPSSLTPSHGFPFTFFPLPFPPALSPTHITTITNLPVDSVARGVSDSVFCVITPAGVQSMAEASTTAAVVAVVNMAVERMKVVRETLKKIDNGGPLKLPSRLYGLCFPQNVISDA